MQKIDKEKALALRQSGYTLQQVADELRCSLVWCKKNLVGVKNKTDDTELINQIRSKGRSKDGTTHYEIRQLVKQHNPELSDDELTNKTVAIKKVVRRGEDNKDVIIRPNWLQPHDAQNSVNMLVDCANSVYDKMHQLANDYREAYDLDISYQSSIVYELSRLSAPSASALLPQGLIGRGDQLGEMVSELSERNK